MPILLTCARCGTTFSVPPSRYKEGAQYCSQTCYHAARSEKMTRPNCTCAVCGVRFHLRPSAIAKGGGTYCSIDCKAIGQLQGEYRICQYCGKAFYVSAANLQRGQDTYCSRRCYGRAQRNKLERQCLICGTVFLARPDKIEKGEATFCSDTCMREGRRTGEWKKCACCGKDIWVTRYRIEHFNHHYCSSKCHYRHTRQQSRLGRSSWKTRAWRTAVLKRDHYTCQQCGQRGGTLHAHHIKPWARYRKLRFDVENGITLCEACHAAVHPHILMLNKNHHENITEHIQLAF